MFKKCLIVLLRNTQSCRFEVQQLAPLAIELSTRPLGSEQAALWLHTAAHHLLAKVKNVIIVSVESSIRTHGGRVTHELTPSTIHWTQQNRAPTATDRPRSPGPSLSFDDFDVQIENHVSKNETKQNKTCWNTLLYAYLFSLAKGAKKPSSRSPTLTELMIIRLVYHM